MLDTIDNEIVSVVYRSHDPIQNLKIRVKLERLTSNALLPSLPRLKIQEDLSRLLDQDGNRRGKAKVSETDAAQVFDRRPTGDYEEVVIGWQEKLFNRLEFEEYGQDLGNTRTGREQKYYKDIRKLKTAGRQPGRIFTYVEGDPYCFPTDLDYFMTDSPNEEPSPLPIGMQTLRKRRTNQSHVNLRHVVNEKPDPEELLANHLAVVPYQTMYIMADLTDRKEQATAQLVLLAPPVDEHVLCKIRVYSNGTLVFQPDFNTEKLAYVIETGTFHNEVYQYYLEHASVPIYRDDLIQERRVFNEIALRQKKQLAEVVGTEFDRTPPGVLKLNIFGEIVSGKNFDYDDAYVHYRLELPENWYAESTMVLSGYTHTARTTSSSRYDDLAYYSCPFEFELWYNPPPSANGDERPRMPKIYFQVASQDTWGRHRTEGYTYIDVPNFPGSYDEHLACWRPRGDSIFDELRRFFIGGSAELDDLAYVAIPEQYRNEPDKGPFSRFGFRTVSTGTLHVRLHVVFQSESIAMRYANQHSSPAVDRYGYDGLMSSVHVALEGFQQVKRRAQAVREAALRPIDEEPVDF